MDAIMKTKDLEITSLRMQLNQLTNDYKFKVKVWPAASSKSKTSCCHTHAVAVHTCQWPSCITIKYFVLIADAGAA